MIADMRISMLLVLTVQPIIALVGMLLIILTSNIFVQIGSMLAATIYSIMAMYIVSTRWRVFLARVMVLN